MSVSVETEKNMYETNDYVNENYEESGAQRDGDPKNGMQKFIEDLDEKHTTLNQNEKKTQNLIKILLTFTIFIFIILLLSGILIGYLYAGNNKTKPPQTPTLTKLTTTKTPPTTITTTTTPLQPGKKIVKPIPIPWKYIYGFGLPNAHNFQIHGYC